MPARTGLVKLTRVLIVLLVLGFGAWKLYDYLFQPGEIRRRVHETLSASFQDVDVEVGSARVRPFIGGINVSDLKLIRRDDPTRTPFLDVPSAIIWFDKSQFANGLVPNKIEMDDAHIRIVRSKNGTWNIQDILKEKTDRPEQTPIIVMKKAHVEIVDQQTGKNAVLALKDADITVINDPVKLYTFDIKGKAHPLGPFQIQGKYEDGLRAHASVQFSQVQLGPELANLVGLFAPDAVEYAQAVRGQLNVGGKVEWRKNAQPALRYDIGVQLTDTHVQHESLPVTLEQLAMKAKCRDGELTVESLTAKAGESMLDAKLEIDLNGIVAKGDDGRMQLAGDLEQRVRRVEFTVKDAKFGQELFDKLPPKYAEVYEMFLPAGYADITYEQSVDANGTRKHCILRPKNMAAKYRGFAYPVDRIRGTVDVNLNHPGIRYDVDLVGEGNGKPVTLKGHIVGGSERDVDLVIKGSDIVLDQQLIDVLPDQYPRFVRSLHPTAKGDFVAKIRHNARIRRDHGPEVYDNEFDIDIRHGSLKYDEFPYPLRQLVGKLWIRTVPEQPTMKAPAPGLPLAPTTSETGSLEFRDFTAIGPGNCKLKIKGSKVPEAGGMLLSLWVQGESVPLDGELARSLTKLKMDKSWATFDPSGRMNCEIDVRIHDRDVPAGQAATFIPARDLELGMAFNGLEIRPTFFPYRMTDVAGQVAYAQGQVELHHFRAKHGTSNITLPAAEVLLPPTGHLWADLYDLRIQPLVFDRELLMALPKGLRSAFEGLELKGNLALHLRRMVIDDRNTPAKPPVEPRLITVGNTPHTARGAMPSEPAKLPTFYWDATLTFREASFSTGVPWAGATGEMSSRGLYVGDKLGRVLANVGIDRATVMKQPVESVSAHFDVDPRRPDIVSVPWIKGKLYGGDVGGEARFELTTPLRFDLALRGSKLKLEELARVNQLGPKTHVEGLATAQLTLSNAPDAKSGLPILQGSGSIDIPNGKMLDLPVILDVIKLARLRPMDHTAFEEAHAVFRIRGNRLRIGQLDLIGNAISLSAEEGEMDLDGNNALIQFYTVWTNIRSLLGGSGEIPAWVSSNLYKIKVSGNLGSEKPKVTQEPLPIVMDPIRRLLGRNPR